MKNVSCFCMLLRKKHNELVSLHMEDLLLALFCYTFVYWCQMVASYPWRLGDSKSTKKKKKIISQEPHRLDNLRYPNMIPFCFFILFFGVFFFIPSAVMERTLLFICFYILYLLQSNMKNEILFHQSFCKIT